MFISNGSRSTLSRISSACCCVCGASFIIHSKRMVPGPFLVMIVGLGQRHQVGRDDAIELQNLCRSTACSAASDLTL